MSGQLSTVLSEAPAPAAALADDDQARADLYALCARLLRTPPGMPLLAALGAAGPIVAGGEFALEAAWLALTQAAGAADAHAVADEYGRLFGGAGVPAIVPGAAAYLAGRPDAVPLADLQRDLARLGLARTPGAGPSEDRLGALCDAMGLLIAGAPGLPRRALAVQKHFFEAYLRPWYAACLADIARAPDADFYRAVAGLLDAFLSVEAQAFAVFDGDT